jgi:hypothetical protein
MPRMFPTLFIIPPSTKDNHELAVYCCEKRRETWSLTSEEEQRLKVFENRVLRGISEPKRQELLGQWRKMQNGELLHQILLM